MTRLVRLALLLGVPLVVVAAGLLIAPLIQPELTAGSGECLAVDAEARILTNRCDAAVNIAICEKVAPTVRTAPCIASATIEPAGEFVVPPVPKGVSEELRVCRAPYLPGRVRDPNNRSLWRNGCLDPD